MRHRVIFKRIATQIIIIDYDLFFFSNSISMTYWKSEKQNKQVLRRTTAVSRSGSTLDFEYKTGMKSLKVVFSPLLVTESLIKKNGKAETLLDHLQRRPYAVAASFRRVKLCGRTRRGGGIRSKSEDLASETRT